MKKGKRKKRAEPEAFIEAFDIGLNDFAISITKIFPPEVKERWARKAYLIKLKVALNMPADDWKYFTKLADTLTKAKMFCGFWTPEMGDVVIDDYGCYLEMVSYLQIGTEDKLVHLDKVIKGSPQFGTGAVQSLHREEDTKFVEAFVERVVSGENLEEAMESTKEIHPVPSSEPVESFEGGKYVIGNVVVVKGRVADRLSEAEKKVEDEMDDEED